MQECLWPCVCLRMLYTCACLLCLFCSVCLCSHHLPADTKFPFLSRQREWNEGKAAEAGRGWAGKLRSSLPRRQFPAKVRCPGPQPPRPVRGRDRTAPGGLPQGRGGWILSSHLARGGRPGSPRGSCRCLARSPGAGAGFWSRVLFRPQHSCPRMSHRDAPSPSGTSGRPWLGGRAQHPPSEAPAPGTLREGRAGPKGPGTPSPPAGSPSATGAGLLQMCFPDVLSSPLLPAPLPLAFFPREEEGWKETGARPESDGATDTDKRTKCLVTAPPPPNTHNESHLTHRGHYGIKTDNVALPKLSYTQG